MILPIKIGNKHHKNKGEYIGRGSPLGNPFIIGKHGTREEVIEKYSVYLKDQIVKRNAEIINELKRIYILSTTQNVVLLCFCKPLPCHGQVIIDVLNELHRKQIMEQTNEFKKLS